ncbi:MAG: tetratricopeptide repeat protein [Rhodospirillaceae bacterium]
MAIKQPFPKIDEKAFLSAAIQQHTAGNLSQAKDLYRAILTQNPRHAEAIFRLGTIALQVEQYEKAEDFISKAIKIGPASAAMFINLGAALRNLKKYDNAIKAYKKALRFGTNDVDAHYNAGRALQDAERYDEAQERYTKALSLSDKDPDIWVNLGVVERQLKDDTAALHAFEMAARLNPNLGAAYSNAAALLFDNGFIEIAMVLIDKAIEVEPENHKYRYELSNFLLLSGDLVRGWRDFDKRFDHFDNAKSHRRAEPPKYLKDESIKKKKLLLWTEQGLGEEILSSSIIQDVIKEGAACTFECSSRLVPIMKRSFPDIDVIAWKDHTSAVKTSSPPFDFQYPALSMMSRFRSSLDEIPHQRAFLQDEKALTQTYRQRYEKMANGKRIVGLSWRSKNSEFGESKTLPLVSWKPILEADDIFFVNLQYGDCTQELAEVKNRLGVEIYQDPDIDPFGDLDPVFSQIAAMDLVISTSNSNVHIAGSMGIPVWSMLPKARGLIWFWFLDKMSSPWYSSARLFRQKTIQPDNTEWWQDLLPEVAAAFSEWRSSQSATDQPL